ncbi:anti-sigma factor [Phenylobacterium sp.]|uniref:anti-sigma factor family protein n=1 Tax=Phenylobacterium sp. TaxID=1871053 RepID=UPI002DEEB90D|nr:anti-sigma factor [Phenylobacterium sp.]
MSGCPDQGHLVHALLDGELDAVNAEAFEAHLKTCPACAAALGDLQGLRERMAAPELRAPAPAALHSRIEAMIAAETERPKRRTPAALPWTLAGVFAAAFAASLAVTSLPSTTGLADQLVADHVRSTLASHLVDVETSDRHTVKPWFNGRIDFAPPVVDLAAQGFPLVGGRVDYLDGRVVAALVYRRNKHVINVFVRPQPKGLRLPAAGAHDGYSLVRWTEGGLEFWAVSDAEPRELQTLKQDFVAATRG